MKKINYIAVFTMVFTLALPNFAFAAPGDLDPTFGVGGKVIDESGYEYYDVATQPNGKIVAVGIALGGSEGTQIAVTRYNIDGSLDTMFGSAGRVLIDRYGVAMDVAIQPDGKIVVATRNNDGEAVGELLRLNSDGSLDTSFGTSGVVGGFLPSVAATLPDGKLLVAFGANLYRLNADGSFDTTFSRCQPGVSTSHYLNNRSESIVQPDGRILTAFTIAGSIYGQTFGVFRCNADGTLDIGFGDGGVMLTPLPSGLNVAQSIAIQTDGKSIVAGQSQNIDWKLTLVRYNPNGSLDTAFGTGGIVTSVATGINYWNPPTAAVAVQADGRIMATDTILSATNHDFALVRHNPNGSVDTTFGGGDGVATVDFDSSDDAGSGMKLDNMGRAMIVGGSHGRSAITRFLGDSPLSNTVTIAGRVATPDGRGLRNATVSITDPLGITRTATTGSFGFFTIDNVLSGEIYVVAVSSKRYRFAARSIQVTENLTGVDFVGLE